MYKENISIENASRWKYNKIRHYGGTKAERE